MKYIFVSQTAQIKDKYKVLSLYARRRNFLFLFGRRYSIFIYRRNVLKNITKIQPITYYFKDQNKYPGTHQIGFNAQEIEKEFPELVNKNDAGYLSVNYPQMSAVAIQAIKEQQHIIETSEKNIEELQKEVLLQKKINDRLSTEIDTQKKQITELQNQMQQILNK